MSSSQPSESQDYNPNNSNISNIRKQPSPSNNLNGVQDYPQSGSASGDNTNEVGAGLSLEKYPTPVSLNTSVSRSGTTSSGSGSGGATAREGSISAGSSSSRSTSNSYTSSIRTSVQDHHGYHQHQHHHLPQLQEPVRPQYHHLTSFPIVSNNSNHLFTLLPNPSPSPSTTSAVNVPNNGSTNGTQTLAYAAAAVLANAATSTHKPTTTSTKEYVPSVSGAASKVIQSESKSSTERASSLSGSGASPLLAANAAAAAEDDDSSKLRTLRYNWTDYEDRLLLKIVLSNHRMLYELKNKPLKRFWELVLDLIRHFSINARISRTHRQCRERFYILYSKLVKFAEQLGVDPSTVPRRNNQGLSFTELEELYLKILQVLRMEDGFKLAVNEKFYDDPKLVELFDKSVLLNTTKNQDESTVSMESSKSSDDKEDLSPKNNVINNITSHKHKLTPLTAGAKSVGSAATTKRSAESVSQPSLKRSKYSNRVYSLGNDSASDYGRSSEGASDGKKRLEAGELLSTPPITRMDTKSYSSLSSGVSLRHNMDMDKPSTFLKNKKPKSVDSERLSRTNVDESSASSLGSGSSSSNSQGESNGENEANEKLEDEDEEDEESEEQKLRSDRPFRHHKAKSSKMKSSNSTGNSNMNSNQSLSTGLTSTSTKSTAAALDLLSKRMDQIDSSIGDLKGSIHDLDNRMKDGLNDAFDKISKYQLGINENINLIMEELQRNRTTNLLQDFDTSVTSQKVSEELSQDLQSFKEHLDDKLENAKDKLANGIENENENDQ